MATISPSSSTSQPATPSFIPEKMATKPPVEIGTKGTVGSLIIQEIEYFNKLEINIPKSASQIRKNGGQTTTKPRRKNRFVPSMCSAIEVDKLSIVSVFFSFVLLAQLLLELASMAEFEDASSTVCNSLDIKALIVPVVPILMGPPPPPPLIDSGDGIVIMFSDQS
ncbi:hypothetical protein LXL04_030949 [Taraxacum kok-saghyz]